MKKNHTKKALLTLLAFLLIFACGCTGFKKSPDRAVQNEEQERVRIERFKENVRRDGDTLYLRMESGSYHTLKDIPNCDPSSPCSYEFVDYYSDPGFYIIFVGYVEGEDYIMISGKDGKGYSVQDLPRLSPHKERVVSVSSCDAYCRNGVFIWRIVENELVSELFYEPEEYARYGFMQWKDDKTIELTKKIMSTEQLCTKFDFMTMPVTLRLEDDGWRLYSDFNNRDIRCGPDQVDSIPSR